MYYLNIQIEDMKLQEFPSRWVISGLLEILGLSESGDGWSRGWGRIWVSKGLIFPLQLGICHQQPASGMEIYR